MFMAIRVRRDIQTAVAFPTTRVKSPDKDDWGKLKRVLKYLNGTKYLKLRLSVDNLGLLKGFVEASHNTHWDCRGHGGAMFTMGKGAATSYSRKVKLNSRSSTETELTNIRHVYAEDVMVVVFHTITRLQAGVRGTVSGQYQYATAHKER